MEFYQTSRPCGRPYNATCGMAREMSQNQSFSCPPSPRNQDPSGSQCPSCHLPSTACKDSAIYTHADQLPPTMAYVPCQKFSTTYDPDYALKVGTVFPELCKPFCGKRGDRR